MADEHARPPDAEPLDVSGVAVEPPLTLQQATSLDAESLLADSAPALLSAWDRLGSAWLDLIERVAAMPAELADERVNGEWSFVQTLRHLIFVVDAWIGNGVLGKTDYDPLGLPPHFVPNGRDLGLDLDATPTLAEVRSVFDAKRDVVREALRDRDAATLRQPCVGRLSSFTVLGAVQVVVFEAWAHKQFAARDLASLVP